MALGARRAGFGCVARDGAGVVVGVRADFKDGVSSSLEAEGHTIFFAMRWAAGEHWDSCIFETDHTQVFNALYSGGGNFVKGCMWFLKADHC